MCGKQMSSEQSRSAISNFQSSYLFAIFAEVPSFNSFCGYFAVFIFNDFVFFFPPLASSNDWRYATKAFIFSLRNKEGLGPFKSMVTAPQWANSRRSGYGPLFGGGWDICIADNANGNTNSYTNFGNSYSVPSGVQDPYTILAGTNYFTPDEVEVFHLG